MTVTTDPDILGRAIEAWVSRPNLPVAFDTETTGLNFIDNRLITLQFMQFGGYCPLIVDVRQWDKKTLRLAGKELQKLFDVNEIVGINLKFDWKFTKYHAGASIRRPYDLMEAEKVLRGLKKNGVRLEHNLKAIAGRYGLEVSKEERNVFIDMDKRPEEWNAPFRPETISYMAQDVKVLEPIYQEQHKLADERELTETVQIENAALPALASIEFNGIGIDRAGWEAFTENKKRDRAAFEAQAIDTVGEAVARVRMKRFHKLNKAYNRWKKDKEAVAAGTKALWEISDKSVGWGEFKKQAMRAWRDANPNPGNPKLDSHSPYAEWHEERERFKRQVVKDGDADTDIDFIMSAWDRENPEPPADDELIGLARARQLCYAPVNIASSHQLLDALQELKVPVEKTAKDVLEDLPEGQYPVVDILLAFRHANTYVTKFGDSILNAIHPVSGRIHPNYIAQGAETGRSSCTNPPWQQIPSKGDGKKLRALVRAKAGRKLLTGDFSNIELRILADMSGDKNMLRFFADGKDLHAETARMMFKLGDHYTAEDIKELYSPLGFKYRDAAKTINFGLVYGMSHTRLARSLKISDDEAKELMEAYFAMYPGVTRWLENAKRFGINHLYSKTLAGRKRYYELPADKYSREYKQQASAVARKAANHPIQGSSADITKVALALFWSKVYELHLDGKIRLVCVVHDEIVSEADDDVVEQAKEIHAWAMDEACRKYLKRVVVPPTVISVSEQWEKA